ncbi:MAG: hypothetical protein ACYC3F_01075 [Gemmatimonadaceae bacterium]
MAKLLDVAEFHDALARGLRHALEHPEWSSVPVELLPEFKAQRQQQLAEAEHDASVARTQSLWLVREVAPRWRARLVHSDDARVRALALANLK